MVSLPSKWVKEYGIEKGDELEVREEGGNLVISSEDANRKETKDIDLTKTDKFLRRFIDVYYRLGYDQLNIHTKDDYVISLIQQEVSTHLLGFEIIEQKKNFCRIGAISKGIEEEFDIILRRIFMMLISMSKEGFDAINKKEYHKLETLIPLEEVNNKFTNFCQRNLNKYGTTDHKKTPVTYYTITILETIADLYRDTFKTLKENGKKETDPKIIELYTLVDEMLYDFYKMFYGFKIPKLVEFDNKWKYILNNNKKWFKGTKTPEGNLIIHNLYSIAHKLHHLSETVY